MISSQVLKGVGHQEWNQNKSIQNLSDIVEKMHTIIVRPEMSTTTHGKTISVLQKWAMDASLDILHGMSSALTEEKVFKKLAAYLAAITVSSSGYTLFAEYASKAAVKRSGIPPRIAAWLFTIFRPLVMLLSIYATGKTGLFVSHLNANARNTQVNDNREDTSNQTNAPTIEPLEHHSSVQSDYIDESKPSVYDLD